MGVAEELAEAEARAAMAETEAEAEAEADLRCETLRARLIPSVVEHDDRRLRPPP